MAVDSLKVPCKVRRTNTPGSGSDIYWFDGVHPMTTFAASGAGVVANTLAQAQAATTMKVFDLSNTDFDILQTYLVARFVAFAELAACESCPTGATVNSLLWEEFPA